MWTTYFRDPRALERMRTTLAAPHLEEFVRELEAAHYRPGCIQHFLRGVGHFARWLRREGTSVEQIETHTLARFRHWAADHGSGQPGLHRHAARGIELFVQYLVRAGVIEPIPCEPSPPDPPVLLGFRDWLRQHRGATDTTVRTYGQLVRELLGTLGDDPARFTAATLRAAVLKHASPHGRSMAKLVVTASRAFVRYLIAEGRCPLGLDGAIPIIGRWRLAALPRALSAADVERVIAACDPATAAGTRDRAILLLLARLGLRAGEVAALRLADIDWMQATLRVAGKSRTTVPLPLPQDVGDAILRYLEQWRLATPVPTLFLRLAAPRTGLGRKGITSVVQHAMRLAGVTSPCRGAHVLRHAAATAMLRQGASLSAIGAVLRHRLEETTRQYAKVDLARLRQLALPWPEVSPC